MANPLWTASDALANHRAGSGTGMYCWSWSKRQNSHPVSDGKNGTLYCMVLHVLFYCHSRRCGMLPLNSSGATLYRGGRRRLPSVRKSILVAKRSQNMVQVYAFGY